LTGLPSNGTPDSNRTRRWRRFPLSPSVVLVGLLIAASYPLVTPQASFSALDVYAIYFIWIALAESWNLVGGYAGLLNLGLVAFFALGSVVGEIGFRSGDPAFVSIPLAGLAGALAALTLTPTFRLKSYYFAMATLVVPLIFKPLVEYVTHTTIYVLPPSATSTPIILYYTGLSLTGLTIFGVYLLVRSRVGIALRAVSDDELGSASIGINVMLYKTVALVFGGFIAAAAGAYYLQVLGDVDTTLFLNLNFSLFPIFMVIIGGLATFEGPIFGAIVFSVIDYWLTSALPGSTLDTFFLALMIIVVAVLLPKGVLPTLGPVVRKRLRREVHG
jgi:branched-chain amino acid transport system permease protein